MNRVPCGPYNATHSLETKQYVWCVSERFPAVTPNVMPPKRSIVTEHRGTLHTPHEYTWMFAVPKHDEEMLSLGEVTVSECSVWQERVLSLFRSSVQQSLDLGRIAPNH